MAEELNSTYLSEDMLPLMVHAFDKMPGGFFIYRDNENFDVLYVNNAVLKIYGCKDREEFKQLTGNSFRGMVYPDDFANVNASISNQIAGNKEKLDYVEYRIIRRDGSIRYVDDYGHYEHTEEFGDLYYVFINDATDKRLAEELERESMVNKAKMTFLFNISHDIRTPMNSIIGFTALARSHINEPELLEDYLSKVDLSNRHMLSLIDDILEMSTIESGQISIKNEECRLDIQLQELIGMVRPQAEEKGITISEKVSLSADYVYVDTIRFRRIISNLLTNAVKFTPEGGNIEVEAYSKEVSKSGYARYEFKVRDNGIGMSEEFLTRIFRAFEREETSTKTGYPGTGLGLSITKSLLDIMGGSISVKSKKGEGSEFTVSLPLKLAARNAVKEVPAAVKAPAAVTNEEKEETSTGKRVLLVEDIEINRILAETVLKKFGFTVESVPDGCDAVEAVTSHPEWYYDLILMDIQMPVMNGYEATKAIRSLGRSDTWRIPIIALSANAGIEDKRMSIESGMDSHIAKPFEIENLINTVREYIKKAKEK